MNHSPQRTASAPPPPGAAPSFNLGDVYYILFRHKWKIILVLLASWGVAAGLYLWMPHFYASETKILIRYILESPSTAVTQPNAGPASPVVKSPDERGDSIINSEIQILTSLDLAKQVAEKVGPEKILARAGGAKGDGQDIIRAANMIDAGLTVEAPMRSSVLTVRFRHPDPAVVQPVLSTLVDTYLKRSVEIHQGGGAMDDFFLRQADQLRTRLAQTEEDLKKLKGDAQIISVDDSKRAYIQETTRIQGELLAAEAELAERRAALDALQQALPTNRPVVTNVAATASVPPDVLEQYRRNATRLESLRNQLFDLRARYTDQYFLVRSVKDEIATAEAAKAKLEADHPSLVALAPPVAAGTNQTVNLGTEVLRVNTLQARIDVLRAQLERVRASAAKVADAEPAIAQLERARDVDEANYRYYTIRLQQARTDESLGADKFTNISIVQSPTPPLPDGRKLMKPLLMILAFGCVGGFAWGFVSDRVLNPTINRVADVERQLPVPLFVSVPDLGWGNGLAKKLIGRGGGAPGNAVAVKPPGPDGDSASSAVGPWDPAHKLRPYYEGLRDRLITFFEVRNMRHKPKMVAITSCAHGAGVTSMAAGLAAALSETGDGNVLLVDMNLEHGAAHPFFQGKPGGILSDALESATRDPAMVQDNLYLVSVHEPRNQQLPSVLPKRFMHLVPKMKASDYDYIIFDMPPVTQTSFTARLAGYMDMVLLVVESEKTGQGILKRAHDLLNESRPNMAAILNKHRAYVPPKLAQEL